MQENIFPPGDYTPILENIQRKYANKVITGRVYHKESTMEELKRETRLFKDEDKPHAI